MIPICDLKRRTDANRTGIMRAFSRVVERGWFILGPEVSCFERDFANYIGVEYCCAVANGTDALELSLRASGVRPGDHVGTVANAGMYTTNALLAIGAEPLFLDVDMHLKVVSISEVERAITEKVKAIVVTHLYGQGIRDIMAIASVCKHAGVILVEDCAQAHGAVVEGRRVGSFGDLACFSFYPTKNLGALGDGGAVVTNNADLAEKLFRLRQYGWSSKYTVVQVGGRNSRLDELQAAVLIEFLPLLDEWNQRRRRVAQLYIEAISAPGVIVPEVGGDDYIAHLFVVRCADREGFRTHLNACGIGTEVHYPVPDCRQPVFQHRFDNVFLTNVERLAREVVTLPCFPEMSDEEVDQVIKAVNSWQS